MGRVKFGIVIFIAIEEFFSLTDSKCGCSFKGTMTFWIFVCISESFPNSQKVTFSVELAIRFMLQLSVLGGRVEGAVNAWLFSVTPSVDDVNVFVERFCKLKKWPRKPKFEFEEFCWVALWLAAVSSECTRWRDDQIVDKALLHIADPKVSPSSSSVSIPLSCRGRNTE